MEKGFLDFCELYLDYLAFLEFTNDSLKIIIDENKRIQGMHIIGPKASELIASGV
jgi:pyruvate/2-oxoglutarate dehydrogenase complex dihydrolipoamide dehydrogenase (E3) component